MRARCRSLASLFSKRGKICLIFHPSLLPAGENDKFVVLVASHKLRKQIARIKLTSVFHASVVLLIMNLGNDGMKKRDESGLTRYGTRVVS